ncbi:MAG: OadG family protein [Lachnospiraceae bacterium]|nr:OadG family protein [Lachnospiraceae bacterium]
MKKLILILGMIACMIGLAACGGTAEETETFGMTEEIAATLAEGVVADMNTIVTSGGQAQYESDPVILSALNSWEAALAEIGELQSVNGHEVTYQNDGVIVLVSVSGMKKDAEVEIILDEDLMYTSITTNVIYTLQETMVKAAMNTLLGMGTVFAVLILISLIISCFGFIPKIQETFRKKAKPVAESVPVSVPAVETLQTIQPPAGDNPELIAVIAAAIAASEGAASADGYVVRSIRRRNR